MLNIRDIGAGQGNATQDQAAFQLASTVLQTAGGGTLYVPSGRYFWNTGGVGFTGPVRIIGDGPASVIVGTGGNATNSNRQMDISSELGTPLTATGALMPGLLSLTLNATTGLSVGCAVYLYLGADPLDSSQPFLSCWNRVASIVGNVVTFFYPLGEPIADPNGYTHKVFPVAHPADGIEVGHLAFERDLASGNLGYNVLSCQYARNVWFHDLSFKDSGFACILAIHSENVALERIDADRSIYNGSFSTASGGFLGGWHVRNLAMRQIVGHDVGGIAVSFEGQNRGITLDGFDISSGQYPVAFPVMLSFQNDSRGVVVKNGRLTSSGQRIALAGKWDQSENLTLNGDTLSMNLGRHDGTLTYGGVRTGELRHWTKDFPVVPNMSGVAFSVPTGWYRAVRCYVSSLQGITNAALLQQGPGGSGPFLSQLVAGQLANITSYQTINPAGLGFNNNSPSYEKLCIFQTNGSVPDNATARLEVDYWPVSA